MTNMTDENYKENDKGGSWEDRWSHMEGVNHENMFDNPVIKMSLSGEYKIENGKIVVENLPLLERYIEQVEFLQKFISDLRGLIVIEFGPAYGGFFKALAVKGILPKRYVMVDGEPMLRLATSYLTDEENSIIDKVTPDKVNTITSRFDLMVSNFCLNETPKPYQDYVFKNVVPLCDRFFGLVDPHSYSDYRRLNKHFRSVQFSDGPTKQQTKMGCIYADGRKMRVGP